MTATCLIALRDGEMAEVTCAPSGVAGLVVTHEDDCAHAAPAYNLTHEQTGYNQAHLGSSTEARELAARVAHICDWTAIKSPDLPDDVRRACAATWADFIRVEGGTWV